MKAGNDLAAVYGDLEAVQNPRTFLAAAIATARPIQPMLPRPALLVMPVKPVRFEKRGELFCADGTIDRKPGGSINFRELPLKTEAGKKISRFQERPGKGNKASENVQTTKYFQYTAGYCVDSQRRAVVLELDARG